RRHRVRRLGAALVGPERIECAAALLLHDVQPAQRRRSSRRLLRAEARVLSTGVRAATGRRLRKARRAVQSREPVRLTAPRAGRHSGSMSLVRRSDLVAQQLATPPWGARRFAADDPPVRVGATGSGADLLLLGWTAGELAREVQAGVALLGRFGVAPG